MALEPIAADVLFDPERRWITRASCRSVDSARFFGPPGPQLGKEPSPDLQKKWDDAKKICSFCPVMRECRRDSLGEEYGVWGGLDELQRWRLRRYLPRTAKRWPREKRLAWGARLTPLAAQGVSWTRIRNMTGIASVMGAQLIKEYQEHRLAEGAAKRAQVVDLPLPPEAKKLAFPVVDGRRHAWVWHNAVFADAHYKGETEDGAWIFVQVFAIKDSSQKWVRAENVRIYHPQPKQILNYIGRPDRAQSQKAG